MLSDPIHRGPVGPVGDHPAVIYIFISDFKFINMIVFIAIFSIITVDIKVEFSIDLHIY